MSEFPDKPHDRTFELLRRTRTGGGLSAEQLSQLELASTDTAGKQASILVVDDSTELRNVLVLMFEALGYENVTQASDGRAALELLREREFDLLVLDIEMPHLDGFGVLSALKNEPRHRHLPVIVASGLDRLEAVVRCIELGAEDFLPKPVNSVLLRARVGASLERKRLRDLERLRLLELEQEKRLLVNEQEKSERLLLNILPKSIAERLKNGELTIAERHAEVTVLFADLVDFTRFANATDPHDLVTLLNRLFSHFDELAGRHGLEKIKTIGDSYLVAGGLPTVQPNHAELVAEMGLDMLAALDALNRERGTNLSMRIGLHSGPVVAGVIGSQKFTYDLWGSTVNLASRMESSGLVNRVNISERTAELLRGKYRLTERGTVDCKGLGTVQAYLLEGRLVRSRS